MIEEKKVSKMQNFVYFAEYFGLFVSLIPKQVSKRVLFCHKFKPNEMDKS